MAKTHKINWWEVDKVQANLETHVEHEIVVQREAIPLVFVPGIMGTRLRRAGTNGTGDQDGLPNLRWDPGSKGFMWNNYVGKVGTPARRRRMLVGPPDKRFSAGYLEAHDSNPIKDGSSAIMGGESPGQHKYYHEFLNVLQKHKWGELSKLFEFPVYAVGYNWTDDAEHVSKMVVKRIKAIIQEAKGVTGLCEKVILITHSMGGIVGRAASELSGGHGSILGIVHGVQPATGAPTAYWRMKAGFEPSTFFGAVESALGKSGPKVTVVLGNIPGGLELLPTKNHRNNSTRDDLRGSPTVWLTVRDGKALPIALPTSDPYEEIYRIKAIVGPTEDGPSNNAYLGLVDPDLLNPELRKPAGGNANDAADAASSPAHDPWNDYIKQLDVAKAFHEKLSFKAHPYTLCLTGTGGNTADVVEMVVSSTTKRKDSYPNQGFRGYFNDGAGKLKVAELQKAAGAGDGTVVVTSARALNVKGRPSPGDVDRAADHQEAFEDGAVQDWAIKAITTLCKLRYYSKR
jgi:hypothetical protein